MARINITAGRHSAFYSPLIFTVAGGFLEAEGLEPNYRPASGPDAVPAMLTSGEWHLSQLAVSRNWGWLEKGETPPILHFAQINERDGFFVTARAPAPAFDWKALEGAEVLVDHGGQPMAMFKYACRQKGVDFARIKAIDAGGTAEMDAAFRAGRGAYIHQQGPAPQQLEHDGVGHVVASVGEAIGPIAFSSLAATPDWLKTDMAKAFMRAYRKARRELNERPAAEIARIEAAHFPGIDQSVLAATIGFYQKLGCWDPAVEISEATYEVALDVFLAAGLITKRHPYPACVAPPPG